MANSNSALALTPVYAPSYTTASGNASGAQALAAALTTDSANYTYNTTTGVYTYTGTTPLYVASFVDGSERARSFVPPVGTMASQYTGAAGNTVGASTSTVFVGQLYGGGTAVSVVMPYIQSAQVLLDSNGAATGPLKLVLVPGTGDITNASSVMTYLLDQDVVLTTVTGTF